MAYAIGIDIGGTFIKYGLVDEDGAILYEGIRPTYPPEATQAPVTAHTTQVPPTTHAPGATQAPPTGPAHVYNNLLGIVAELQNHAQAKGVRPIGIGIGVPAIVDDGKVTGCQANLPELDGMRLGSKMQQDLGLAVWVDNDANLMGLAEWKFGAARGLTDVIFLTIGTGIGGAMIINGQLYAGYRNRGAELGHIIIVPDGLPCGCGGRGCLEAQASVEALIEDYRDCLLQDVKADPYATPDEAKALQAASEITGRDIVARYQENQPAAHAAMNRHFEFLGAGIAGLINIFSPQKLIIGGGISEAGSFYIDHIRQRTSQRVMKETSLYTTIEAAELGNKAGFLGAAALALAGPAFGVK